MGFACLNWPHLHRAYVVTVPFILILAVFRNHEYFTVVTSNCFRFSMISTYISVFTQQYPIISECRPPKYVPNSYLLSSSIPSNKRNLRQAKAKWPWQCRSTFPRDCNEKNDTNVFVRSDSHSDFFCKKCIKYTVIIRFLAFKWGIVNFCILSESRDMVKNI